MTSTGAAGEGGASVARVLLVEDDPLIASFMAKALTKHGFAPCWVSTGADALAALADGDVRVVLLDLGLPDIEGLEVLRRVRRGGSGVPVVVVTSSSDPADRSVADELGVDSYLVKPFAVAGLVATVTMTLRQRSPGS